MKQLIRFLITGTVNTALMYGVYLLLLQIGMHYQLALIMDYLGGALLGYVVNREWTFADRGNKWQSFLRYAFTYVGVYIGNAVLLSVIVEAKLLGPVLGQLVAITFVVMASFLIQKYWVFQSKNRN